MGVCACAHVYLRLKMYWVYLQEENSSRLKQRELQRDQANMKSNVKGEGLPRPHPCLGALLMAVKGGSRSLVIGGYPHSPEGDPTPMYTGRALTGLIGFKKMLIN